MSAIEVKTERSLTIVSEGGEEVTKALAYLFEGHTRFAVRATTDDGRYYILALEFGQRPPPNYSYVTLDPDELTGLLRPKEAFRPLAELVSGWLDATDAGDSGGRFVVKTYPLGPARQYPVWGYVAHATSEEVDE